MMLIWTRWIDSRGLNSSRKYDKYYFTYQIYLIYIYYVNNQAGSAGCFLQ